MKTGSCFVVCVMMGLTLDVFRAPAQPVYTPSYTFTTLAGSAPGSVDGTGSGARFNSPAGLVTDAAGNVYVADPANQNIRKITAAGVVTTLAGMAGFYGSADGTGSVARFYLPFGLALDTAGNLYVADRYNNEIRKVTPSGVVTTFAGKAAFDIDGNPVSGRADGTGAAAGFDNPYGLAIDSAGNLYVSDMGNNTIRKITPEGLVSTIAGQPQTLGSADGTGTNARFYQPQGLAVDGAGNIYVADSGNDTIRKVTPDGVVTTVAGSATQPGTANGTGSAARFFAPAGVALDSAGNLYVADSGNDTIRKLSPFGVVDSVTNLAGFPLEQGAADGTAYGARFTFPNGVALDAGGNLYVSDGASTIRKVTPSGMVTTLAGQAAGSGAVDGAGIAARFAQPNGAAVDGAGNVFVADTTESTIRKITPAGVTTTFAGFARYTGNADGMGTNARFDGPQGLAVDGAGNLYVADTGAYTIRKVTPAGLVSTLAGGKNGDMDGTGSAARFAHPVSLAADASGNVYVADTSVSAIRKVTPAGVVTTLTGWAGANALDSASGVAVDSAGNIYVADTVNHRIQKRSPSGVVATLAGLTGQAGSADGMESAARFYKPSGVAVDGSGHVYVADQENHTIRMVTSAGVVTTIGGLSQFDLFLGGTGYPIAGSTDGPGNLARFNSPASLAADPTGNIYIADTGNNVIRKGVLTSTLAPVLGLVPGSGFIGGQFAFTLSGPPGQTVVVQASSDLAVWLPVWTNTFAGSLLFVDPAGAAYSNRFYRAALP